MNLTLTIIQNPESKDLIIWIQTKEDLEFRVRSFEEPHVSNQSHGRKYGPEYA
jgi:hypothetical protein